jgi:hypothetical protein
MRTDMSAGERYLQLYVRSQKMCNLHKSQIRQIAVRLHEISFLDACKRDASVLVLPDSGDVRLPDAVVDDPEYKEGQQQVYNMLVSRLVLAELSLVQSEQYVRDVETVIASLSPESKEVAEQLYKLKNTTAVTAECLHLSLSGLRKRRSKLYQEIVPLMQSILPIPGDDTNSTAESANSGDRDSWFYHL